MKNKPKVLIIYTGGTIGMINNPETGALRAFNFDNLYKNIPELSQFDYELEVKSLPKPIDSSEITVDIWGEIAKTVFDNYNFFDGFVILHGSDTMAYTASALSFMLQGLKKPVILTGSQLPIGQIRTDGKENLITAIEIAGKKNEFNQPIIQEVAIYFEYSLYRGNRSTKISANHFEAFESPNYPPLAVAGIDINFNHTHLYRTQKDELVCFTKFDSTIGLLKLFPSMPVSPLKHLFNINNYKAVIIESYGSGNSFYTSEFENILMEYTQKGGVIINTTQCSKGSVNQGKYESSNMFKKLGVISAFDSTTESILCKTMYAFGRF